MCCLSRLLRTLVMPYCSGAVATVSSGPVSYKMPVPSHSRYTSSVTGSSYRTTASLSSSLDRPYYSGLTRTIPRSYTSEYKLKHTSPSRYVPDFCYPCTLFALQGSKTAVCFLEVIGNDHFKNCYCLARSSCLYCARVRACPRALLLARSL